MARFLLENNRRFCAIFPRQLQKACQENCGKTAHGSIYPVFRLLLPNQVIGADDLAKAMEDGAIRT